MSIVLPLMFLLVFGYGLCRKIPVVSEFSAGVADGFKVCGGIFPILLLMVLSVGVFRASGAMDWFVSVLAPLCDILRIPPEILPLALVRPLSGGGALSLCEDLLLCYGVDSYIGRLASVLSAATETTFYTLGVYLGRHRLKGVGKFLLVAVTCDLFTLFFSAYVCRVL